MTFKYRIGQKVEVLDGGEGMTAVVADARKYIGLVAVITAHRARPIYNWYDLEGTDPDVDFREDILKPINDGDCPSTWSECLWKPNEELCEIL